MLKWLDSWRCYSKTVVVRFELVAAEAKYHRDSYVSFLKPATGAKIYCPKDEATNVTMKKMFPYTENNDW